MSVIVDNGTATLRETELSLLKEALDITEYLLQGGSQCDMTSSDYTPETVPGWKVGMSLLCVVKYHIYCPILKKHNFDIIVQNTLNSIAPVCQRNM